METPPAAVSQLFRIGGRVDANVAMGLRAELMERIESGNTKLVLELSDVGFIDSTGLSVLITALKQASAAGGEVVLANATANVRSIIEVTGLHRVFRMFDDEQAALQAIA